MMPVSFLPGNNLKTKELVMAVSQYEKDRIARVAARTKRKATNTGVTRKKLTPREREQRDIDQFKAGRKNVKDTRSLDSLTRYGKPDSTATSGGSKAVRKIDPTFKGSTTPARTKDNDLVNKLRRKPFKYLR